MTFWVRTLVLSLWIFSLDLLVGRAVAGGLTVQRNLQGGVVLERTAIRLSVDAVATGPIVYRWYKNGVHLPDWMGPTLEIPEADLTDAGGYQVELSEGGQTLWSGVAQVRVEPNFGGGLVPVMGGTFSMGNPRAGAPASALPVHQVLLSSFLMGETEVTFREWEWVRAWAVKNGYSFETTGQGVASDHPVHSITWYDAVKWCNARSEMQGLAPVYRTGLEGPVYRSGRLNLDNAAVDWSALGYRLPTEAEWEYAARGGGSDNSRFPFGDFISHGLANYVAGSSTVRFPYDRSVGRAVFHPTYRAVGRTPYTNPVKDFPKNRLGLYGLAGNVWEYCWDWFGPYSPDVVGEAIPMDPRGPTVGFLRVARGGCWAYTADNCGVHDRQKFFPTNRFFGNGFRVVKAGDPLRIVRQPASVQAIAGRPLSLSVLVSGVRPISYVWSQNGVVRSDLKSASVRVIATPDFEGTWSVRVVDAFGQSLQSSNAVVSVLVPPKISDFSATTLVVDQCQTATLSVTATGTPPLAYQWFRNSSAIAGATGPQITLQGGDPNVAGRYYVTVTNVLNGVAYFATPATTLTMARQLNPEILQQPQGKSVLIGSTHTLSVTARGSGLSYQWFKDGSMLSGKTDAFLMMSDLQRSDGGTYEVEVRSECGVLVRSRPSVLRVISVPAIVSDLREETICRPDAKNLSVTVAGDGPFTYKWYRNGVFFSKGVTGMPFGTTSFVGASEAGRYEVVISNDAGEVRSSAVDVTVSYPPMISKGDSPLPKQQRVKLGGQASMTVEVTGTGPLTYRWFRNRVEIPGANGPTLGLENVTFADEGSYTVEISNACGSVLTKAAMIDVGRAPTLTLELVGQSICPGDLVELRVEALGDAPLRYEWRLDGAVITGARGKSIFPTRAGKYAVTVSNDYGSVTSEAVVVINSPPTVDVSVFPEGVKVGDSVTFKPRVSDETAVVKWYRNGVPLTTSTRPRYTVVPGSFTWKEAKADAEARGGHLVTVTSDPEWERVKQAIGTEHLEKTLWMGGTRGVTYAPDPLEIVFVVDVSGSMGSVIRGLKDNIIDFLNNLPAWVESCRIKFVSVSNVFVGEPIRVSDWFTVKSSQGLASFDGVLPAMDTVLTLLGGGPEESILDGIATAINLTDWSTSPNVKRAIVAFSDEPSLPPEPVSGTIESMAAGANSKNIQIELFGVFNDPEIDEFASKTKTNIYNFSEYDFSEATNMAVALQRAINAVLQSQDWVTGESWGYENLSSTVGGLSGPHDHLIYAGETLDRKWAWLAPEGPVHGYILEDEADLTLGSEAGSWEYIPRSGDDESEIWVEVTYACGTVRKKVEMRIIE